VSSQVTWSKQAEKDLRPLDAATRGRIVAAVTSYAETGQGDVRRYIEGERGELALRVGDLRVFILPDRGAGELLVKGVRQRGRAYR